jgi:hypothetical protein
MDMRQRKKVLAESFGIIPNQTKQQSLPRLRECPNVTSEAPFCAINSGWTYRASSSEGERCRLFVMRWYNQSRR